MWLTACLCLVVTGCIPPTPLDLPEFASLDELAMSGQAIARVYGAPIPMIEQIAIHTWFVVKTAESETFTRWELWQTSGGPYGHVRRDRRSPEADVGSGGTFVIAEIIGAAAESVVQFIESQSPQYCFRDEYVLLGPNSNTYTQWVLDQTGWSVQLPPTAIGMHVRPICNSMARPADLAEQPPAAPACRSAQPVLASVWQRATRRVMINRSNCLTVRHRVSRRAMTDPAVPRLCRAASYEPRSDT
jgi:hypothetical protein